MNINIRGDKLDVTDSIRNYVISKLERLNKYFEDPTKIDAHVLIKVKNQTATIEVTIPTKPYTLRAEENNSDLYAAIDLVIDKLEGQIRKNKTKINRLKNDNIYELAYIEDDVEEEVTQIVKRKNIGSKPMGEEEAILQLELLGHDFFVFKNVDEDDCISVLYKRRDGNYGIINSK